MALEGSDAEREAELIRGTQDWPRWPWLPIKRPTQPGQGSQLGLIHTDDIDAEGTGPIRVFAATADEGVKLMAGHLIEARSLKLLAEYDSVEALISDRWRGD